MRVSELAKLTGCTVRTIRHYHAEGLLPVPDGNNRRDYDLSHVARLSRIRWLAAAGLPLPAIRDLLGTEPTDPRHDLEQVLTGVRTQQTALEQQRQRTQRLLDVLTRHADATELLTPMPAVVAAFYATQERNAPDEATRRVIRQERDFTEVAYYRGEIPPGAEQLFPIDDPDAMAASLAAFTAAAHRTTDLTDDDIDQVATTIARRLLAAFTTHPETTDITHPGTADTDADAVDLDVAVDRDDRSLEGLTDTYTRLADTYTRLTDGFDPRVAAAIATKLLAHDHKGSRS